MSVLVYAEWSQGKYSKPTFEAVTYARDLAAQLGTDLVGVTIGQPDQAGQDKLKAQGLPKLLVVNHDDLNDFHDSAYARVVAEAAKEAGANVVVVPATYNVRMFSPRLAIKLDAAHVTQVTDLPTKDGDGWKLNRTTFSGKAVETVKANTATVVIAPKANSYGVEAQAADNLATEDLAYSPQDGDKRHTVKELKRQTDKVPLTEAEVVVSGGRGMKGPENWDMIEELADLLNAATACSKPVADIEWRPHHEHVGQTGIQIAPNVYMAFGISGAIQHLAGVNSSKTIFVINKDPEAPFFKAADYGMVADVFDVLPKLIEEVKNRKAAA